MDGLSPRPPFLASLAFAIPAFALLSIDEGGFASLAYSIAAVLVIFAVLAFVLALCGVTVRIEWGKVKKIWFERIPSGTKG